MNAVVRLNLLVAIVFTIAFIITALEMLEQATKDITREVTAGVNLTHQLLSVAVTDDSLLQQILHTETRHVSLEIVDNSHTGISKETNTEGDVPDWFQQMIPGLDELRHKQYFLYLPDGRSLKLQADPEDEVEEVWESFQSVLILFGLSALLSNLAIYLGVRQGIKPVADFLAALNKIEKGHYATRLNHYSISEIDQLSGHFNSMAQALEHAETENRLLTHELMRIQERERAYLARELHDDLGQYLTGIRAQAWLIQNSTGNPDLVASVGGQIAENCNAMQISFRQLIRQLHPVMLEELGLLEAIKAQISNWQQAHNIPVTLELPDELPSLGDESQTHIYRIVQEALNNIAQHAQAEQTWVCLSSDNQQITLNIADNGSGNLADETAGKLSGLGLRSMRERARCLKGELVFNQVPGRGSSVKLQIPLQQTA